MTVFDISSPGYCKHCKRGTLRVTDITRSVEKVESLGAVTVSLPGNQIEYTRTCDCGYTQELKKFSGDPLYYITRESLSKLDGYSEGVEYTPLELSKPEKELSELQKYSTKILQEMYAKGSLTGAAALSGIYKTEGA